MKKNYESAFPSHGRMGEVVNEGMNLRDYFAAKALPAIISLSGNDGTPEFDCRLAYSYADTMMKERDK